MAELRGTDEHARTKWAGQFETHRYLVGCAHFARAVQCVNHRKFSGRPSLRVPPGSFAAKYHVYVYYYTANRRLCMGVPPYRSVRPPLIDYLFPVRAHVPQNLPRPTVNIFVRKSTAT